MKAEIEKTPLIKKPEKSQQINNNPQFKSIFDRILENKAQLDFKSQ